MAVAPPSQRLGYPETSRTLCSVHDDAAREESRGICDSVIQSSQGSYVWFFFSDI